MNKYIKQCIENCRVLPVPCPDSKCQTGFLSSDEVKFILLSHREYSSNTSIDLTDIEQKAKAEAQNLVVTNLYNKYLKICENIGNNEFK